MDMLTNNFLTHKLLIIYTCHDLWIITTTVNFQFSAPNTFYYIQLYTYGQNFKNVIFKSNLIQKTFKGIACKTRGPRGPWVAHLGKRSKVPVEPIIENPRPRGIIWTTLVEDLLMILYIKYESSGLCSFRQEDFWKFHFKTYLLTPWPTYTTNWNGLNNFDRGPPRDHSCEVWSNSH